MFPFIAKVHYYEDNSDSAVLERKHTHVLLYAETFADAAAQVEEYFGVDMDDMKLWAVGDEGTFFEVSGTVADAIRAGLGNYKEGVKILEEVNEGEEQ